MFIEMNKTAPEALTEYEPIWINMNMVREFVPTPNTDKTEGTKLYYMDGTSEKVYDSPDKIFMTYNRRANELGAGNGCSCS